MNKVTIYQLFLILPICFAAGPANAVLITQSHTFNNSAGPVSVGVASSDSLGVAGSSDLTATFLPFNGSLGTLDSFSIVWTISISGSAVSSPTVSSVINSTVGGPYSVAGVIYGGNGGGNGATESPGEIPLSFAFDVNTTTTFQVADAGLTYPAAILPTILGSSAFDVTWFAGFSVNYTDASDVSGTLNGDVSLTYNYSPPSGVPEPMPLALLGIGLPGLMFARRLRRR